MEGLVNRKRIHELWDSIAGRGRGLMGLERSQTAPGVADIEALSTALISSRGQASGVKLAGMVLDGYASATVQQRLD